LIVYATGYHIGIPVLETNVLTYEEGLPQLVNGLLSTTYKNLFVFGVTQVRYGAGPLISGGAELVSKLIEVQKKLKTPIGSILYKSKLGHLPKRTKHSPDILVDPHTIYLTTKMGTFISGYLPIIEKITRLF